MHYDGELEMATKKDIEAVNQGLENHEKHCDTRWENLEKNLDDKFGGITRRLDDGADRFERIEKQLDAIKTQITRWLGGMAALLGLLGVIATLTTILSKMGIF